MFMKIFKNLFGNGDKIDSSEIATIEDSKEIALDDRLTGVVLYNDETGSNDTITLNDSVENYKYVEVFFFNNDKIYSSQKFYKPNDKIVLLLDFYINGTAGTNLVFKIQTRKFSNNSFSVVGYQQTTIYQNKLNGQEGSNQIYVTRVVAYK